MIIKTLAVGEIETNCYIVMTDKSKEGVVIDPGDDGHKILRIIQELGVDVKYILNTHGHMDHIGANGLIKEETGAQILIHEEDSHMLTDSLENLSTFLGVYGRVTSPPHDGLLGDGDVVEIQDLTFEVLHTPGHTRGGLTFKAGNVLFTGDTLFADSIGRTDFPGGSHSTLMDSVKRLVQNADDEIVILPGHGPQATLGEARRINPYLYNL